MKIIGASNAIGKATDGGQPRAATAPRSEPAQSNTAEQVEISPLSARLQEIEANLGASPIVNAVRVAEIKQAISDGRFKINPEQIADGLLTSVRQMLAKHS